MPPESARKDPDPASSAVGGLNNALTEIVRKVKDPVLLTGIAGAILLVLLAILGPDGSRMVAIVLAGVIVAAMVVWAWTRPRKRISSRQRARRRGLIDDSGLDIRSTTADVNVSSDQKATSGGQIRGSGPRIRIGSQQDEDEPSQ